ncbi:hypothetical protein QTO34_013754 [Cnephaeus nilssonii]|uniref:Uncharacterized protein n=1 Tax=Cnephaeus nilssonii TaxID=3371016 RepID=A0AA40I8K5_CNENI|nr:hypothetical protein QTO34_013754 [Eptesicus nilssonii]
MRVLEQSEDRDSESHKPGACQDKHQRRAPLPTVRSSSSHPPELLLLLPPSHLQVVSLALDTGYNDVSRPRVTPCTVLPNHLHIPTPFFIGAQSPRTVQSQSLEEYQRLLHPLSFQFTDTKQYPVFVGHKPGRNSTQRHRLDIQMIMIMNRTLYIAARDHIYTVDIDTSHTEEIYCSKVSSFKTIFLK